MTRLAAASAVRAEPVAPGMWPPGISRVPKMRISEVLAALTPEFKNVTHSKLRFLEEQGLIHPVRTQAGYRQYSLADVERLRFVLSEQRDSYLPLKVIKERLAAMDSGDEPGPPPGARLAGAPAPAAVTRESVAATTGASLELIDSLVASGLITADGDHLEPGAVDVVLLASKLGEHGIEARHLRPLRAAAERQVNLVEQLVAPRRRLTTTAAAAEAATLASEVGELLARMHLYWVRTGIEASTRR